MVGVGRGLPPPGVDAAVDLTAHDEPTGWWRLDAAITLDDERRRPAVGVVATPCRPVRPARGGDGPHECYPDGGPPVVGRWRSSVADQYVPYAFPQEHGHHTGLRWLAVTDPAHRLGLLVVADEPGALGWSVRHHDDAELFAATHVDGLTRSTGPDTPCLRSTPTSGGSARRRAARTPSSATAPTPVATASGPGCAGSTCGHGARGPAATCP